VPETHVIVDTGPLVAFLIKEEAQHRWVSDQFQRLPAPFVTCEPVLTETFFLLRRIPNGPTKFFALLDSGLLHVDFSLLAEKASLEKLVRRYSNVPMSLADACLVRIAELNPLSRVFTLDSDFHIYRQHGRQTISILKP
jgi:predicted nucleic acid-binding protein